jgi:methionine transaminase
MSKLPNVGTTIFTKMSRLALEYNAINLSQGFPNFPIDEKLITLIKEASIENVHQYAPMTGTIELLTKLSSLTERNYQRKTNPVENILITAGATQAIYTIIQALVHFQDEVVIIDPSYDCYSPSVILAAGIPIHVEMNEDFSVNWEKVNDAISSKTKMIIVNNPHNPSGKIFTEQDISSLEIILEKNPKVLLLSDEVYEYITFENKHISINTRQKIMDRSVIVSSFGKTFHITGWKIGYIIAPRNLMNEIKKVHQFLVFSVNSLMQVVLARYLDVVDVNELSQFYVQKRDFFQSLLSESRFKILPSEGTYFQLLNYSDISDESDIKFTEDLTLKFGIATIPMSVFYKEKKDCKVIRLCFAKDNETLIKAAQNLCKI